MFSCLADHPPLFLYRSGKSVRVVRYGRALRPIKKLMAKSGQNPDEFSPHSLRTRGATTLAAGGGIGESDAKRREVEVRRVQGVYAKKHRGFEKGCHVS